MDEPTRSIIHEREFERELRALIADAERADMFIEGAEYVLARDPYAGLQTVPGSPLWAMPMAPIGGRQVTLFYMFDDSNVWLLAIHAE